MLVASQLSVRIMAFPTIDSPIYRLLFCFPYFLTVQYFVKKTAKTPETRLQISILFKVTNLFAIGVDLLLLLLPLLLLLLLLLFNALFAYTAL